LLGVVFNAGRAIDRFETAPSPDALQAQMARLDMTSLFN
jgi:hypothetical protein